MVVNLGRDPLWLISPILYLLVADYYNLEIGHPLVAD